MLYTKRLFLALILPAESKHQINRWRLRHLETLKQPAVPFENYHITLVYIGALAIEQQNQLISRLKQIRVDSFNLTLNKTDYWSQPKVLHLQASIIPPRLIDLQRNVNQALEQIGLTGETRQYQPHLTLYRKISSAQFEQLEQDGLPEPHELIAVEQFALFESISTPDGVRYEVIEEFDLSGIYA